MQFVKLADIDVFTVNQVGRPVYKKWDNNQHKMLTSDNYQEGYRKMYPVDTDKGRLDLSSNQLGQALLKCFDLTTQKSEIRGKTLTVKTNNKTGLDIRYYINLYRPPQQPVAPSQLNPETPPAPSGNGAEVETYLD